MEEGSIHVLEASFSYSWVPFHLKHVVILYKTKKGILSLYNRIVSLIACPALFKETYMIFLLLCSHTYLQIISTERSAVRLANGEQPAFRQVPIKARKPTSSDTVEHRDEYSLDFTLEWKCCLKGLVLSAKDRQGKGSTWEAQVWHSWTTSSFEYRWGFLREARVTDN